MKPIVTYGHTNVQHVQINALVLHQAVDITIYSFHHSITAQFIAIIKHTFRCSILALKTACTYNNTYLIPLLKNTDVISISSIILYYINIKLYSFHLFNKVQQQFIKVNYILTNYYNN